MKTILLLVSFFFVSFISAQVASIDPIASDSDTVLEAPVKAPTKKISKKSHSLSAIKQLNSFLAENLKYNEILRENGIEGQVLLEIVISKDGSITNNNILESSNTSMDSVVLDMMQSLKAIQLDGKVYHGASKINVPIHFSL